HATSHCDHTLTSSFSLHVHYPYSPIPHFLSLLAFSPDTPPSSDLHTLSLHDALPISSPSLSSCMRPGSTFSSATSCPTVRILMRDRKSTRLNSSHVSTSYAVFCLRRKTKPKKCWG